MKTSASRSRFGWSVVRKLSIIMPYFEAPQMLQYQYAYMREYAPELKARLEYVLVDDNSQKHRATFPMSSFGIAFKMYKMDADIKWGGDSCKNIGVYNATHEWVLTTDIDHIIPEKTIDAILNTHKLSEDVAYRFHRLMAPEMKAHVFHPNSWLFHRNLYRTFKGYDERLAGCYSTNSDFTNRVKAYAPIVQLLSHLITIPTTMIPDASMPESFGRKSPENSDMLRFRLEARAHEKGGNRARVLSFPYHQVTQSEEF